MAIHSSCVVPVEAFVRFCKLYSRATETLCRNYMLERMDLYRRIIEKRSEWQKIKFIVKCIFLEMYSWTTPQIENQPFIRACIVGLCSLWDRQRLRSCPQLNVIASKYYTNVKYFDPKLIEKNEKAFRT
jgi:hypothetical protein